MVESNVSCGRIFSFKCITRLNELLVCVPVSAAAVNTAAAIEGSLHNTIAKEKGTSGI